MIMNYGNCLSENKPMGDHLKKNKQKMALVYMDQAFQHTHLLVCFYEVEVFLNN